jgi:hypothetical protein
MAAETVDRSVQSYGEARCQMQKEKMQIQLKWPGILIELCLNRINRAQKDQIDAHCLGPGNDICSLWYDNPSFLRQHFNVDNWWSLDDLDRAVGLVFPDRADLERRLSAISVEIDGSPKTVDPEAIQLSFYLPEAFDPVDHGEWVLCHGLKREALLELNVDSEPPFDPSLITLSFIHYADYGYILIDLDYDGHDDVQFTLGDTTFLKPRFLGKETIDDASRPTQR